VKSALAAIKQHASAVKGLAHITGGGLLDNVPRILQAGLAARLYREAWEMPALFRWLQEGGRIADEEMYRVFNCGIGMVVVVAADQAHAVEATLNENGEQVFRLGEIVERAPEEAQTVVV
jgi:phosphoribosylformylglycinamidine cyclo-ligase